MKKIERGSIKYLIILIISTFLFAIIIYPLVDLICCEFFTKKEFIYSIEDYIIQPLIFSLVFGVTYWFVDKKLNS